MKKRVALIDGIRTPMCKAGTSMKNITADDLGAFIVREILLRNIVSADDIDEVITGNVAQPADAANIGRVIALKAGLPVSTTAYTVNRNCASGMEAVSSAANKILAGEAKIIIAAGTESMSNIPFLLSSGMKIFFESFFRARSLPQKMKALSLFRPGYLAPVVGIQLGLTDPVCGLNMGQTAEFLAKDFNVTREEQDEYALLSHRKAVKSIEGEILAEEIIPLPLPPDYRKTITNDNGPRDNLVIDDLKKLKPYFDNTNGTVTVGNACPLTDGAASVLVMSEEKAKELGLEPLGYLKEYAYAALEPDHMGLGPAYATALLLKKTGMELKDIELIEMNESFAVQIIANERAFASEKFANKYLRREKALGEIDRNIMNVNGGAIALGHPVGMTGMRIIITLLRELKRRKLQRGMATLCVGGGQGASFMLETE